MLIPFLIIKVKEMLEVKIHFYFVLTIFWTFLAVSNSIFLLACFGFDKAAFIIDTCFAEKFQYALLEDFDCKEEYVKNHMFWLCSWTLYIRKKKVLKIFYRM